MNLEQLIERYISYRQSLGERFSGSAFILRAFSRFMGSGSSRRKYGVGKYGVGS